MSPIYELCLGKSPALSVPVRLSIKNGDIKPSNLQFVRSMQFIRVPVAAKVRRYVILKVVKLYKIIMQTVSPGIVQ